VSRDTRIWFVAFGITIVIMGILWPLGFFDQFKSKPRLTVELKTSVFRSERTGACYEYFYEGALSQVVQIDCGLINDPN